MAQPAQVALPVGETFESGLRAWALAAGESGTIAHQTSAGNPGGYAKFTDSTTPSSGHLAAPAPFLGSWTSLEGAAFLSWEHQIFSLGDSPTIGEHVAFISGPGGTARYDSGVSGQLGSWVIVSAPIQESSWVIESGNWDAILADVTELRIRIEVVSNVGSGPEIAGLDNVLMDDGTAQPPVVPVVSSFDASTEGWTLLPDQLGTVVNNPGVGNPGGAIVFIDDVSGSTGGHIVAPAAYRGSWAALDGQGWLAWEHKVLDLGLSPTLTTMMARISGPGGAAEFLSGTLASDLDWVSLQAPINESQWTVTAGSWAALLAHVTDLQIEIEGVVNDTGIAGDNSAIDNVQLFAPGAVPVPALGAPGFVILGLILLGFLIRTRAGSLRVVNGTRNV